MKRGTLTQLFAFAAMLGCLLASTIFSVRLSGIAGRHKLVYTDRAEESTSPEVAMGIALGAFRGIFVNFLWIRANDMKQDGKFFDAIQLADAITRLQPRFPRVWVFHAWNMAYNISVATQTDAERWDWVNQGVRLLRDKGIPANPNDMLLHKELAWIFLHKIGGVTDDANTYYKKRLALEWTVTLGNPPRLTPEAQRDRAKAIDIYANWLQPIADAPESLETLTQSDPAVAALVEKLNGLGVQLVRSQLLAHHELIRAVRASGQQVLLRQELRFNAKSQALEALIADPANDKPFAQILAFVRRRTLIDEYHMEPDRMVRFTRKYGPLDWRHHAAHSLYWSARGVEVNLDRYTDRNHSDFDFVNTDRLVVQSVQDLFRSGELYFDFLSQITGHNPTWQGIPNAHFADTYGDILDETRGRSWADRTDNRGFTVLSGGYENFLRDVICFLYRRNDVARAEKYYQRLREFGGLNLNDSGRAKELSLPLAQFVEAELKDRSTSPSVAVAQISAAIMGAFTSGLQAGDKDLFDSQMTFAREFHKHFFEKQGRMTNVSRGQFRMEQLDRSFPRVVGRMYFSFMGSLSLDDAERVYSLSPNDLKQYAYDALDSAYREPLTEAVKQGGRPFDVIFPPPPGMAEFRAQQRAIEAQREGGKSEVETR